MAPYQISPDGICNTCETAANRDFLECRDCKIKFHALCGNTWPCTRTFLGQFKTLKNKTNFPFICDHCVTKWENDEASTIKDQLAELKQAFAVLTNEVRELKGSVQRNNNTNVIVDTTGDSRKNDNISNNTGNNSNQHNVNSASSTASTNTNVSKGTKNRRNEPWSDLERVEKLKRKMTYTVCIKSNEGQAVDAEKVKNIITRNGIQVNRANVNQSNGDLYVECPSQENHEKLLPLLTEEVIPGNKVISLKHKCPTITFRGIEEYTTEEELIDRIKAQNEQIKSKLENGSTFTVVFTKEHKQNPDDEKGEFQVVARVSEDIRAVIKANREKIFLGFKSHHVTDRFYVKTCSNCHQYGHYHANCTKQASCGYCSSTDHLTTQCPVHKENDQTKYKCTNCEANGRESAGHSCFWKKCPTYIDQQNNVMRSIPYYSKNFNRQNNREKAVA